MIVVNNCIFHSIECKYGDVQLKDDIPNIFAERGFHPICGHGFWNTMHGYNTFCKLLRFQTATTIGSKVATDVDAMRVGECKESDTNLTKCSAGNCNDMKLGGACTNYPTNECMKGSIAIQKIKCMDGSHEGKGFYSSCVGGW